MADSLADAALDFARYCLKQPESFIETATHTLQVRPDGFDSGPESFADCNSFDYKDRRRVQSLVEYWCSLNDVDLEILRKGPHATYRFISEDSTGDAVETSGSIDFCYGLLSAAAALARRMKSVNPPQPSMSWSEFIKGRDR